jgi:hypothetical protein
MLLQSQAIAEERKKERKKKPFIKCHSKQKK